MPFSEGPGSVAGFAKGVATVDSAVSKRSRPVETPRTPPRACIGRLGIRPGSEHDGAHKKTIETNAFWARNRCSASGWSCCLDCYSRPSRVVGQNHDSTFGTTGFAHRTVIRKASQSQNRDKTTQKTRRNIRGISVGKTVQMTVRFVG